MSGCAASTPTPCRSTPIAAPAVPRPPTSSSAWSTVRRARLGHRSPTRSAARNFIPPPADALQDADRRPDLRHRRFRRSHMTTGHGTRRLGGLQGAAQGRRARTARSAASASPPISSARPGARARTSRCGWRGRHRDRLFRHAIERAGPRHGLCAVRRPASRPAARQDPGRAGRHGRGSQTGARHRRLALDPDRRRLGLRRVAESGRQAEGARLATKLEAAVADLEIADGAVRVVGTDRRITFTELARPARRDRRRRAPGRRELHAAERDLSERHAYRRGRDRPGHRRHRDRALYDLRRFRRSP